jgi:3-oxoacyl-[acyl-carrier-protein] synthase-3
MMMKRTVIRGTGRYLPPRIVTNEEMTKWMDTSDEWIQQRTGIEQRHWIPAEGGVGSSDLGLEASKIAMQRAGWKPEDIDLIIMQHKLGLDSTPALDIRQQCTGFLYGLTTADAYIRADLANRILLVGAEVHSTGLDISTEGRDVAVIFGDGAGAVCLESTQSDEPLGVLASALHADGKYAESLMAEVGSSRLNPRISHALIDEGRHWPKMDGKAIFKLAVQKLPEVVNETLEKVGLICALISFLPNQ